MGGSWVGDVGLYWLEWCSNRQLLHKAAASTSL